MLHNEARKLMAEAYERTHNTKEAAKYYSVDVSTVYRLARQKKRQGLKKTLALGRYSVSNRQSNTGTSGYNY